MFTVVTPVKDEGELLRYSLPAIYALKPDEVILCFDNPAHDPTLRKAQNIASNYKAVSTKILHVKQRTDHRYHQAWARRKGFLEAEGDLILTVDSDKVVDPDVAKHFHLVGRNKVGLVSFTELPLGFDLPMFVGLLLQKLGYHDSFMGLYAMSKKAWRDTEDTESVKDVTTSEDTHLHEQMKRKYKTVHVANVKCLNLRPSRSRWKQYHDGIERRRRGDSLLKVILSSILYLRPLTLLGFVRAK